MSKFEGQVYRDYKDLLSNVSLRVGDDVGELLLLQSVIGHAQNGHGRFCDGTVRSRYPNATLDDIAIALDVDPVKIRKKRQGVIDSIFGFTAEIMVHSNYPGYVDSKGDALLSLTIPIELDDPAAVLKGIYLASKMDNFEWRAKAIQEYGVELGGGECVALDIGSPLFRGLGYTLEDFANGEWNDDQVESLKEIGIVVPHGTVAVTNKVVNAYIRHKRGKGTSDDMAIVLAGRLYGKDAAVGVFLCDAIDTWDKYAEQLIPGGQDEYLGTLIEQQEDVIRKTYPGFELPSEEDIIKFIYTIALKKSNTPEGRDSVSNSQRYLLQVDELEDQCAMESHLDYIVGKPYREMRLGHIRSQVTNTGLYSLFEKRFNRNYQCR